MKKTKDAAARATSSAAKATSAASRLSGSFDGMSSLKDPMASLSKLAAFGTAKARKGSKLIWDSSYSKTADGKLVVQRSRPVDNPGIIYRDGLHLVELPGVEVTPQQFGELKELFSFFDYDRSGMLEEDEMRCALQMMGVATTEDELDELTTQVDTDGDGNVSWEEFLAFSAVLMNDPRILHREMTMAFMAVQFECSTEGDSESIDADLLKDLLMTAGNKPFTPEECAEFLATLEPGKAGTYKFGPLKQHPCFGLDGLRAAKQATFIPQGKIRPSDVIVDEPVEPEVDEKVELTLGNGVLKGRMLAYRKHRRGLGTNKQWLLDEAKRIKDEADGGITPTSDSSATSGPEVTLASGVGSLVSTLSSGFGSSEGTLASGFGSCFGSSEATAALATPERSRPRRSPSNLVLPPAGTPVAVQMGDVFGEISKRPPPPKTLPKLPAKNESSPVAVVPLAMTRG